MRSRIPDRRQLSEIMPLMATRKRQDQTPSEQPRLLVPREQLRGEIDERLELGHEIIKRAISSETELRGAKDAYYSWSEYNVALLRRSFQVLGPSEEYAESGPGVFFVGGPPDPLSVKVNELHRDVHQKLRRLESLQGRLVLFQEDSGVVQPAPPTTDPAVGGKDVFIVHGRNETIKQTVARFLDHLLGYPPVILHEQADRGRTVIEKFEDHVTEAAAAVVLLTGDDVGGLADSSMQKRARQNVVLELGFFIGTLGRARTVILYEPGVELPSDLDGVLYVEIDQGGAWKNAVARELKAVGLETDLTALLK